MTFWVLSMEQFPHPVSTFLQAWNKGSYHRNFFIKNVTITKNYILRCHTKCKTLRLTELKNGEFRKMCSARCFMQILQLQHISNLGCQNCLIWDMHYEVVLTITLAVSSQKLCACLYCQNILLSTSIIGIHCCQLYRNTGLEFCKFARHAWDGSITLI